MPYVNLSLHDCASNDIITLSASMACLLMFANSPEFLTVKLELPVKGDKIVAQINNILTQCSTEAPVFLLTTNCSNAGYFCLTNPQKNDSSVSIRQTLGFSSAAYCLTDSSEKLNSHWRTLLAGQPNKFTSIPLVNLLRVYRHLLLGDSCRYVLLDLRASFWRQSRISN